MNDTVTEDNVKTSLMEDFSVLRGLLSEYIKPYWPYVIVLTFLSILGGVVSTLPPLALAPALDVMVESHEAPASTFGELTLNNLGVTMLDRMGVDPSDGFNVMLVVAGLYIGITLLSVVISLVASFISINVRSWVYRDVQIDMQRHLLKLPLSFFHKTPTGDLISRFTRDANFAANYLDSFVQSLVLSVIQVSIYLTVLIKTEPKLALSVVCISSAHLLITKLLSSSYRKSAMRQTTAFGRIGSVLQESLSSIRVVKSFAAEEYELKELTEKVEESRLRNIGFQKAKLIERPLRGMIQAISIVAIMLLAYKAVNAGRLTAPGFALFLVMCRQVLGPISRFSASLLSVPVILGSTTRLMEIFNTKDDMPDGPQTANSLVNHIELKNVRFAYDEGTDVLSDVNLEIRKGETVALVGPSGGGKTTLADLLLRLYDVNGGAILYDGVDIRAFDKNSYRMQFGVVPQETQLFNQSLKGNVVYNHAWDEARFHSALHTANAKSFVDELPEGVETFIGERGVRLSGGQRQRIAIARAIYSEPSVLVLDEATSALDSQAEKLVQEAIEQVTAQVTAVIIAHRLSTVRHADKIVVVESGRIIAVGNHDALYGSCDLYTELCNNQFSS